MFIVGTTGKNNMIITQSIINNCEVKNNDLVNNNFVKLIAHWSAILHEKLTNLVYRWNNSCYAGYQI